MNPSTKVDIEELGGALLVLSVLIGTPAYLVGRVVYNYFQERTFIKTGDADEEDTANYLKRLNGYYNTVNELIIQKSHKLKGEYQDFMLKRPHRYMLLQPKMAQMNKDIERLNTLLQKPENISLKSLTVEQRDMLFLNEAMPDEFLQTIVSDKSTEAHDENPVEQLMKTLFQELADLQRGAGWQISEEDLKTAKETYESYVRGGTLDEAAQQNVQTRLNHYYKVAEQKYRESLDYMKENSDDMKLNDPKAAAELKNSIIQMNKTTYWYNAEQLKNPQVTVKGISPSRLSILLEDGSFEDFVNDTRGNFEEHPKNYPHAIDRAIVLWDKAETAGKPIIDDYFVTQRRLRKEQADRDAIRSNQEHIIRQNDGTIAAQREEISNLRSLVRQQQDTLDKQKRRLDDLEDQRTRSRRRAEDAAIGGYVVGRALGR